MSDANRVSLAYAAETSFGTLPGSPAFTALRYVSESLKQETDTTQSNEVRADRQISKVTRTGLRASGGLDFELSYGAYDDFWAALLFHSTTWTSGVSIESAATDISAAASDNSFNSAGAGFTTTGVSAGDWVKVSGFTGSPTANNGYFKVVSITTSKIVVSGGTLVDDAAGEAVTIASGDKIENGTTFNHFTIERQYEDLSNEFAYYPGMTLDTGSLNITTGSVITGSFGFLGKQEVSNTATLDASSGYTAAPTNDVMNAVENVAKVIEGTGTSNATELSFSVENNLRERLQIATLGAISVGAGTIAATGSFVKYFESKAIANKYLNFTDTSIAYPVEDASGKAYVFDFPQIKYTDCERVAGGVNTDVFARLSWSASADSTENVTVRISRWAS